MTPSESGALSAMVQSLQWALLGVDALLVLNLAMVCGDTLRRLGPEPGALIPREGLALRSLLPDAELVDRRLGATLRTGDARGRRQMLAFISLGCRPCLELIPHLNRVASETSRIRFIAIVPTDDAETALERLHPNIAVVEDDELRMIGTRFKARYEPFIYVADHEGRITIRAVANSLLELQDALDGYGHQQMTEWTPRHETTPTHLDGVV